MCFEDKNYEFSFPSLYGDHQIDNASTAISTILSINDFYITLFFNVKFSEIIKLWGAF